MLGDCAMDWGAPGPSVARERFAPVYGLDASGSPDR
jgi:hypothetical protein